MITHISFENFKSIKEMTDLRLKPLTLLTGSNSSGKSNILEGIALFAEASRLSKISGVENVELPRIYQQGQLKKYPWHQIQDFISYRKRPGNMVKIEINVDPDNSVKEEIGRIFAEKGVKFDCNSLNSVGYGLSFRFSDGFFSQYIKSNRERVATVEMSGSGSSYLSSQPRAKVQSAGSANYIFGKLVFRIAGPETNSNRNERFASKIAIVILNYVRNLCEGTYLISGERGNIDAERRVEDRARQREELSWVGSQGQYVIDILSRLITKEPEKAADIRKWAAKFQIPDIRAGYVGEGKLESHFTDGQFKIGLNSALAGLGSRQILSIIVQIFSAEPRSVIMIEEPEISLHPENQVLLHELFAAAISQGKQIICTTHSPFLILAVSKIIKKKLLKVNDVAIYHVERDREGTKLKELKLNKHGFLISGVPGFMKVERELFREWSQTLEEA
jgi:AAA15 family ATPase/GTPase